jgi:hypothetical protein
MSLPSNNTAWRQPAFAEMLTCDMHASLLPPPSRLSAETTRPGAAGNPATVGPTLRQGRLSEVGRIQ